ncbi:hypothetical protein MUK42_26958 [Musa troglodytarum]|uniref:Uncharacterized protein n=1 Tax=Musa troglodytarum TaxID=320322 RepID=A0A9E7GG15_9LILI|nr:hypothetical protein MUK42_26958 [Musa troglodytarum]
MYGTSARINLPGAVMRIRASLPQPCIIPSGWCLRVQCKSNQISHYQAER